MNWKSAALCLAMAASGVAACRAQAETPPPSAQPAAQEIEILQLSRQKWLWMAERNTAALDTLFHEKAVFVHMSRTLTKAAELDVITTGNIQYKKADIEEESARFIGDTAIVLSKIRLLAIVRGEEVTNPFTVTEVYVRQAGQWKLGSLSFTRLVGP